MSWYRDAGSPVRRWLVVAAAVAGVAVATAGCAGSSPGDLSPAAQRVLVREVQHVREAAATGSYARLAAAVARLKTLVRQERNAGQVSDSRATAIMDAADTLLQDASPTQSPSPPSSSSSPSRSPSPSSSSPSPSPSPTSSAPSSTATSSSSTQSATPSQSSGSVVVSVGPSVP